MSPSDAIKFAPVLERMIELLGVEEEMTFGEALESASTELGIEVPDDMQGPLLASAFQVIAGQRIPGAADA